MTTREPDDDLEIRLSRALDASDPIPEHVLENLRPIRSVVAWSQADGSTSAQTLFVHIQ